MPTACTLDVALTKNLAASYLIIEWLRQVSIKCCCLWAQLFAQLHAFFNGTRPGNKHKFHQNKARLTFHLGRVCTSIEKLDTSMQTWPPPVR